jgi:hypothetical protein
VFDVSSGRDAGCTVASGGSRFNVQEANLALALFQELRKLLVSRAEAARLVGGVGPEECRVGILSPYRCCLLGVLALRAGDMRLHRLEIKDLRRRSVAALVGSRSNVPHVLGLISGCDPTNRLWTSGLPLRDRQ